MRKLAAILLGLTAVSVLAARPPAETGALVAVVYNTDMQGSREVAYHYAAMRNVPTNQILGLKLPTRDVMTRDEYSSQLEKPFLRFLSDQKLLVLEPDPRGATPGALRVSESSIRYVVLCYGVPVRINEEPGLKEPGEDKIPQALRRNGAAVDSELCLAPWPDPHRLLASYTGNPVYGVTNGAFIQPQKGILMVARLDGPSAEIATGLVDKALQAESFGLWGRAYFDLRIFPPDETSKKGDRWIKVAAEAAEAVGFDTIVEQTRKTFSPGYPMSHIALYAGWYDPEVSGPFAQPHVEFMPGAFAYHLHSYSAQHLRSATNNWVGPLLADGATATMGCVDEPYLDGTPNIGLFFLRFLAGFSFGEAAYASQGALSWQTTVVGDPLYRPFGKDLQALHQFLAARQMPMLQWSHERVINLSLNQGVGPPKLIRYLLDTDITPHSPVLLEKLGDLYKMEGESTLALSSWRKALEFHPSTLQAMRLQFDLAAELAENGKEEEALEVYTSFLKENPSYPDAVEIYEKMDDLAKRLRKPDLAASYEKEIARRTKPAK
jgi:uncharacterized protein (TIGR03790 family)